MRVRVCACVLGGIRVWTQIPINPPPPSPFSVSTRCRRAINEKFHGFARKCYNCTCPPLPQDDFLACVAGTMDGRNWIIIQYYCQLLRWLRFGLRLCWSQSVSLVGVQKLVQIILLNFEILKSFSLFHFPL